MTLPFLIDVAGTQKRSLTVVSVDHSKAFDSVDSRAIPVVLRHYAVPDKVIADVMQLYHGYRAAVSTSFGLAEAFDTTSGVLQGDTLSPHLFILLVDYIHRQSFVDEDWFALKPANGRRNTAVTLKALAYAEDSAITSESASGAEKTLRWHRFHSDGRSEIERGENKSSLCRIWEWSRTYFDIGWNDDRRMWHLQLPWSTDTLLHSNSPEIHMTWSTIGKLHPMIHSMAPDALKIKLIKSAFETIAAYALEFLPLNPTACSMPVIGRWFALHSALIGRTTSRTKKFTLNSAFCRSVRLSEKEDFAWSATRCVFGVDLSQLSGQCCNNLALYSRYGVNRPERGLWRRICSTIWTQLTATSTMLLTSVLVSLLAWLTCSTQIFIVEERLNIIYIIIMEL